jgi:hypothetical protein
LRRRMQRVSRAVRRPLLISSIRLTRPPYKFCAPLQERLLHKSDSVLSTQPPRSASLKWLPALLSWLHPQFGNAERLLRGSVRSQLRSRFLQVTGSPETRRRMARRRPTRWHENPTYLLVLLAILIVLFLGWFFAR